MKDFDDWFKDFLDENPYKPLELPEGVEEREPGVFVAECCRCGEYTEIPCDISEIPMEGFEHYCGRGPHCCP